MTATDYKSEAEKASEVKKIVVYVIAVKNTKGEFSICGVLWDKTEAEDFVKDLLKLPSVPMAWIVPQIILGVDSNSIFDKLGVHRAPICS